MRQNEQKVTMVAKLTKQRIRTISCRFVRAKQLVERCPGWKVKGIILFPTSVATFLLHDKAQK